MLPRFTIRQAVNGWVLNSFVGGKVYEMVFLTWPDLIDWLKEEPK